VSNYRLPDVKNAMCAALATDLAAVTGGLPWIVSAEWPNWAKFKRSIPRTDAARGGIALVTTQNSPDEEGPFNSFKNRARLRVRYGVHLPVKQDSQQPDQPTTLALVSAVEKQVRTTITVNRDWSVLGGPGAQTIDSYCKDIIAFDDGDKDLLVFDAFAEVFFIWSVP